MQPSEEIKQKLNIVDVIADYVELRKAGVNYKARCPFHEEKTPSFVVSPVKQIWHCFGCGMGGDVFEFVKEMEAVDFPEALRMLAARAGVEIRQNLSADYQEKKDEKKVLYEINELAAKFYEKVLSDSQSAQIARDYLGKRGFKSETIKKWRLGYAPDDFHAFESFIVKKGYQKSEAEKAGLLSQRDGPPGQARGQGYYDRFRARIMFPLFDLHGQVAGFTARILDSAQASSGDNAPKYINSPETLIYNKSRLIYGLNFAKTEIRKLGEAVVVEGNVDVITSHEFGFQSVIGTSGTALTEYQLEILKKLTENISFALDVDDAGLAATRRAVELALRAGFNVKIISIPGDLAKDPDELIRKDPAIWKKQTGEAVNFLDFYFRQIFAKMDLSKNSDKKQAARELLPLIALLPDPIDRSQFTKALSERVQVSEEILLDVLKASQDQPSSENASEKETRNKQKKPRQEVLEERALGFLIKYAPKLESEWGEFKASQFTSPRLQNVFGKSREQFLEKGRIDQSTLDPEMTRDMDLLTFAVENELAELSSWDFEEIKAEYLSVLQAMHIKKQMNVLTARIRAAEDTGRLREAKELISEFNHLSKELNKHHGS